MRIRDTLLVLGTILCLLAPSAADAATPRVFPEGKRPDDSRLKSQKHLNAYFPFLVPGTREAWEVRKRELKQRILVSTGLWPMPQRTPLKPAIYGKTTRPGFTVEKVHFESVPGHFVTGLLFRPAGKKAGGKHPAVLCPHGHGGRLQDYGVASMAALIKSGAEKFTKSGRFPKLARCATLARMGCVTLIYDMEGYADAQQIGMGVAHRLQKQRAHMNSPDDGWGFISTQAELRLQSIMGLQTWNSIRGLDFLAGLPDVDPKRIGVTGGSGGGTQTILLCAIDPRPVVAFPNGMVSTSMQGGCTCENCCLLRIGTGNVELAALFAPKPQGMTAANDWTKEMMTKGYPELRKLYGLYGKRDHVLCRSLVRFPHNYNYVSRRIMYNLFSRHLGLGDKPVVETDYEPLTSEEYTVWDKDHPAPKGGEDHEKAVTGFLSKQSQAQLASLVPRQREDMTLYRGIVGGAIKTIIGRGLPRANQVDRTKVAEHDRGDYLEFTDILRLKSEGESLPVVSFFPKKAKYSGLAVVWVDGRGKAGLYGENGRPIAAIRKLLDGGAAVLGADLLYQGEFLAGGKPLGMTPKVSNNREFAAYTFGYNHTVFASRVHDILTLLAFVKGHEEDKAGAVALVGTAGAGPLVATARVLVQDLVDKAVVGTGGFRFVNVKHYRDPEFLPGAVKYGDLPGLLSLAAPLPLWLAGEKGRVPQRVQAVYKAMKRPKYVVSQKGDESDAVMAAVPWLLGQ